jgi:hypothetical protein
VREAHEIALELDRAVPGLEGEGGAPHEPEVGLEEGSVELVGDAGATEHRFGLIASSNVKICLSLSPNAGASTRWPSRNRRDLDEVFIVSFQAKISWVTVRLSLRVGIEENRS